MNNLSYFVNRICTVLTNPVNFTIKSEIQHSQYFTGRVVEITDKGIWIQHLNLKTFSFFSFPIVGIVEEQFVSNEDPVVNKIKEELTKKDAPKNQFIPIDQLSKMVKSVPKS